MVIDIDERCETLGIAFEDYDSATRKIDEQFWNHQGEEFFGEYKNFLTKDELVAAIRWDSLHICWPQYFTWDGAVE